MTHSITSPHVGGRVFTERGLDKHGPFDAPHLQVDVDPASYGFIERVDPYRSFDPLYFVKWDTGQVSGHYPRDFEGKLICIGPFKNLDGFQNAFRNSKFNSVTVEGYSPTRIVSFTAELGGDSINAPIKWERGDERLFEFCDKELWQLIQRVHGLFLSHRGTVKHLESYLRPRLEEYKILAVEPADKCCSWPKKLCKHRKAKAELVEFLKLCEDSEKCIANFAVLDPFREVIEFSDGEGDKATINLEALCGGQFDLELLKNFNARGWSSNF